MNIKDAFGFDVFVISADGDVTEIESTEDAADWLAAKADGDDA